MTTTTTRTVEEFKREQKRLRALLDPNRDHLKGCPVAAGQEVRPSGDFETYRLSGPAQDSFGNRAEPQVFQIVRCLTCGGQHVYTKEEFDGAS